MSLWVPWLSRTPEHHPFTIHPIAPENHLALPDTMSFVVSDHQSDSMQSFIWVCLVSPSIMSSKLIPMVINGRLSFLWGWIKSILYMYTISSPRLLCTDRFLSWFALWTMLQGLGGETALQDPNFSALGGYYKWGSWVTGCSNFTF